MKMIGEILIENGLLTKSDLDKALSRQKNAEEHQPIGEILIAMGLINIKTLLNYLDVQIKDKK